MLDAMFLIQRSLYLRLKQTRHPHGIMDLYVGSFWGNRQWGYSNSTGVTFPIAFKECYAVVSNAHSNTTGNTDHYHLLSWTSTGAAFGYWNMSFYGTLYIALGVE
jgi:hypothetical protein